MNRSQVREMTLQLSVGDRLLLLWDLVRSLLWPGRSVVPSKATAICLRQAYATARIEQVVDRLCAMHPQYTPEIKEKVMERVRDVVEKIPEQWQIFCEMTDADLVKKLNFILAAEALGEAFSDVSEEEMAEFEKIVEGR